MNIVKIAALLIAIATTQSAQAGDTRIIIHGLSNHLQSDVWTDIDGNDQEFNEVNLGLGFTYEWIKYVDLRLSAFKNSFDKLSIAPGIGLHTSYKRPVCFILQAGVSSGYKDTPTGGDAVLVGYIMPTLGLNIKRARVELGYIPKIGNEENDSSVIILSLAVRI